MYEMEKINALLGLSSSDRAVFFKWLPVRQNACNSQDFRHDI